MNNRFDCDVNVRVKSKVRVQRGESCCAAADSAWICLMINFPIVFNVALLISRFNDAPVSLTFVRLSCQRVWSTPVVTMQTPHHVPKAALKEHNGIRAACSSKWGGGKSKPVMCVRLHARALDSPGRRKGPLQQHVATMMRSPDRGS